MDKLGFLQLSTLKPFIYHMGNQVDETTLEEVLRDNLGELMKEKPTLRATPVHNQISRAKRRVFGLFDSLARFPFIKKSLQRIYILLFEYYAKTK
jgi:hypothetical protein